MTRVLGIVLPLGFFCQFVVGHVIDAYGLFAALTSLWAVGVLLAALQLVPVVAIQVRRSSLALVGGFKLFSRASS